MKRANRPVPIQVPVEGDTAAANFKLTDSGVWSEGGLVFSTAGCIIDKGRSQTGATGVSSGAQPAKQLSVLPAQSDDITLLDRPQSQLTVIQESSNGSTSSRSHACTNSSSTDTQPSSSATTTGGGGSHTSSPSSSAIVLSDLQELAVVGSGSSGVVKKVMHRPTQQVYVLKLINLDMGNQQVRRQVTREVRALDGARHPHVVSYHQSFFAEGAVTILMEFMDGGTLWDLLQKIRVVPEPYLAELTRQMLLGLSFLHDTARICHRDVKPSNLLLSSNGQLKISDFGTSSQLSNSMSKCLSWVGTVTYMSPERIRGDSYGFNTDVWSLGLLVLECAVGRYPYPPQQPGEGGGAAAAPPKLGFWELLEYIVVEPPPRLSASQFSPELVDFVSQCLQKDAARRPSASQLLLHPFVTGASSNKVSLADLLKLPRQQQQQSGSSNASGRGGGSSVRRSGSYGGARDGPCGVLRQSSGGFGGVRGSLSGLGGAYGSLQQHSWQQGSIMGRPPVAQTAAQPAKAAPAPAAAATVTAPGAQDSVVSKTEPAAAAASGARQDSSSNVKPAVSNSSSSSGSKAPAAEQPAAGKSQAAAIAAVAADPASRAAAADPASSPGSPQPTLTTSPPAGRGPAGLSGGAGAAAGSAGTAGSGPVTPAMAAAAAAALRESSPLLSGQLMRQSVLGGSMLSRQAGGAAAAAGGLGHRGLMPQQQQYQQLQQPLHQAVPQMQMRQSMQQHQQPVRHQHLQPKHHQQPQGCGPLQQQQHWLNTMAGQQQSTPRQQGPAQHAQGGQHPPKQQAQQQHQQQVQQQQGPLAQQLAGMHLLQQHQQHMQLQQQRSKSESPHSSSRQQSAGAVGSPASVSDSKSVSSLGRRTPEKQHVVCSSAHGSPVVGQGPLTALKPSTSKRLHEGTGL